MTDDKTIIIHLKTKDIEQAKVNYNRLYSTFENPTENNTNLPIEASKELITDEIAFQRGQWCHSATPNEIFVILHNLFVDRHRASQ